MCKRALNVCMVVLHVCKKALKLVQWDFARVQKGIEVSSRGVVTMTKITSQILYRFPKILYRIVWLFLI